MIIIPTYESDKYNKHYSVFEFIAKLYNKENETVEKELEFIDSNIFFFAQKLIDCSFINSFDSDIIELVKFTLENNKLPKSIIKLGYRNGKLAFYYSNDDLILFIKMLYASSTKRESFYEFLKVRDVLNILYNLYSSNIFFYNTEFLDIEGLSLKKQNVIKILEILGLLDEEYKAEYCLLSGCAMLLYELRESVGDVDLCVTQKAFKMLDSKFPLCHCGGNKYSLGNLVEIFVKDREEFICKEKKGFLVEDLRNILVAKIRRKDRVMGTKKEKKDKVDIYTLRKYIEYHKNY